MQLPETKVAVLSIIVEDKASSGEINELLHRNAPYIKGRFGLPDVSAGVSVICVVMNAPQDVINSLTGKLGMVRGVKAKTLIK